MEKVKRYEDIVYGYSDYDFEERQDGSWVTYEDYAALEKRAEAAEADVELGMQLIKRLERQVLEYQAKLVEQDKQERQTIFAITDNDTGILEQLSGDDVYFTLEDAGREVARRKRDYQEDYRITAFSNSPAPALNVADLAPKGWKLVPVEPTEDMVIQGFESEPKLLFIDPEDWDKYESMSGCQQAAHKTRLCWAAMLEAAPTPPQ